MRNLDLVETQIAIKYVKDNFENALSKKLNIVRVSAPLFVTKASGLNDTLNGFERRIEFQIGEQDVEIVQSLAKRKRDALKRYNFKPGEGLYTDMNAIRKDEKLDDIHSAYVDQWDWEKVISEKDRNLKYLFKTVRNIYSVIKKIGSMMNKKYGFEYDLPEKISFVSTTKLKELYPSLSPKEREYEITKKNRAVFIYKIGWPLKNEGPHDGRAADYDDWNLNGDIIVFDDVLDKPLELSSMGIRVNKESLIKQSKHKKEEANLDSPYCQNIINDNLPLTIGGGIGHSRLCMFYLKKKHICEVQASVWDEENLKYAKNNDIEVL